MQFVDSLRSTNPGPVRDLSTDQPIIAARAVTSAEAAPARASVFVSQIEASSTPREIRLKPCADGAEVDLSLGKASSDYGQGSALSRMILASFAAMFLVFALYVLFVYKDIYVAEAQIVVKSASNGAVNTVGPSMAAHSLSAASTDAYVVDEYINSRDAMKKLEQDINLKALYRVGGLDFFHKYFTLGDDGDETFYRYYKKRIDSSVDGTSGLNVLRVQAFRPDDAKLIATSLVNIAEQFVNALNQRAIDDTLGFSNEIMLRARERLADAEAKLTAFRAASGVVDPARESAARMDEVTKLSKELSHVEVSIAEQSSLMANSPALRAQRDRARAYRDEISRKMKEMAGAAGSIASIMGDYDRLSLDKQLAAQGVVNAEQFRERALQDAQRKHLYLQVVVPPTAPDQHAYPHRPLYLALGLLMFTLAYMLAASIHRLIEERAV